MLRRTFSQLPLAALRRGARVATFQADVTPPIGSPLYTGPARSITAPLEARGIVLLGAGRPIVIAAMDWCEIRNSSYDLWRDTLARAAGTVRQRVLLSCVHQHDAPYTDAGAQKLFDAIKAPDPICDVALEQRAISTVAAAIQASLASPRQIGRAHV